jgi:hypothetical protein
MRGVRRFARFWYDFIVGDDWTIAAWVVGIVGATGLLARRWDVWPLLPLAVIAALALSLRRAVRDARATTEDGPREL